MHCFLKRSFLALVGLLLFSGIFRPNCLAAEVVDVQEIAAHDGDTFRATISGQNIKIRLFGVDSPELDQPGGEAAREAARSAFKTANRVYVEPLYLDRYKRTVALVYVDGVSLSEALISFGYAWVFGRYCDLPVCESWKQLEEKARLAKSGLWSGEEVLPPWEWRAQQQKRH